MTPRRLWVRDEAILAAVAAQAKALGMDPQQLLNERAMLGLRVMFGLQADLGTADAARYLGVHTHTLFNYHKRGLLPGMYLLSARKAMWPIAELDRLKERTVAISKAA